MNTVIARVALALLVSGACLSVQAQAQTSSGIKSVTVEPVPPLDAFYRWTLQREDPEPLYPAQTAIEILAIRSLPAASAEPPANWSPQPVILGAPALPLRGGQPDWTAPWTDERNYQGVRVSFVVLSADGSRREVRPVSSPPRPGERFRVRILPSFDAVSHIESIAEGPWNPRRAGRIYPRPGFSVAIDAGEIVELPLDPRAFMRQEGAAVDRMLLVVRHAHAERTRLSTQPAYRQDGPRGSHFVQLVGEGGYPYFEQIVTLRN